MILCVFILDVCTHDAVTLLLTTTIDLFFRFF